MRLLIILLLVVGCNTLEPVKGYCEVAFAYPTNKPLPDLIEKKKIGCACSIKDILRGRTVTGWVPMPIDGSCRRVRGFHPSIWADPIDPYFQFESKKREKKKK